MNKQDDLIKLWEQDGDLERMRNFFGRVTDGADKDRIKQMVLAKLAQEQGRENNEADSIVTPVSNPVSNLEESESMAQKVKKVSSKTKQVLKNSWQRWSWKMALPAAALVLVVVIGQSGILGQMGLMNFSQSKSTGMAAESKAAAEPAAAMDSFSMNENRVYSQPQIGGSPEMSKSKDLNMTVPPIAPPLPGPEPATPPADASLPRKITHNLYTNLQVDDIELAVDNINNLAKNMGGYIVDSQIDNNQQYNAYANMTIKIPADKFEGVRDGLKNIGKVLNQHLKANDITNQYYDADTRLRNWQAEQERYLEILKQANNVNDILMVENSLSNIRMQIEQLKGQLKLWDHEVAYSTVQLQLQTKPKPVSIEEPWQPIAFKETLEATQNAVLKTISTIWNYLNYLVVGLGYAFPLIVLGSGGYFIYRQWRKSNLKR